MNPIINKQKVFKALEDGFNGSPLSKILSCFIVLLIITNVAAVVLESYAPISQGYHLELYYFNIFSVVIFTIEYVARLWACTEHQGLDASTPIRSRIKYFFTPVALVDLVAIVPFYLAFIIPIDLRYLRMLRMLRLLKLTHYFKGLRLFGDVLKKELPSIGAAVFIVTVLVILSASVMYSVEHNVQPDVFGSIPDAIWWSVVTMTTVGYGDVVPVTFLGKFISIFIMLLGVGIVALPAAMLAAKFGDELRLRRQRLEKEIETALDDGVITSSEKQSIDRICSSMGVSGSELEQIISNYKAQKMPVLKCDNCGCDIITSDKN